MKIQEKHLASNSAIDTTNFDNDPELDQLLMLIEVPPSNSGLLLKKSTEKDNTSTCHQISDTKENKKNVDTEAHLPIDFRFPYRKAYSIQEDFMKNLYDCLANGKHGIFESPTGTGKSLSLLCASLTWLNKFNSDRVSEAEETIRLAEASQKRQETADDWLDTFESVKRLDDEAFVKRVYLEKVKSLNDRLNLAVKNNTTNGIKGKKFFQLNNMKRSLPQDDSELDGDDKGTDKEKESDVDDFLLEDYFSDSEDARNNMNPEVVTEKKNDDALYTPKIFYAARTHSQLGQFVSELKKTKFDKTVRMVTLGSRQNTCINNRVKQLGHLQLMNDHCLQMQQNSAKIKKANEGKKLKSRRCQFYRQQATRDLADVQLTTVQDIEELVQAGIERKCCPYYASRYAVLAADLVLMPYQILLSRSAREACDVRLKDNVVIIDEAHNLIDTINAIHSCTITFKCINSVREQLRMYKRRYEKVLNPSNLMYIRQILHVLAALSNIFLSSDDFSIKKSTTFQTATKQRCLKINDFLFLAGIAEVNIFKLTAYIEKSQICRKLSGFAKSLDNSKDADTDQSTCSMLQVSRFFECLTNSAEDGRILVASDAESSRLKFISLNCATHFKQILLESRSVILAGGTMQPVTDFVDQLFLPNGFSDDERDGIKFFSCGHIVPASNLLPLVLSDGPTGRTFEFVYKTRYDTDLIDELGRSLLSISNMVPGGIVCFFTSYEYANTVYDRLECTKMLEKLQQRKKLFRESKKPSSQVADLLDQYAKHVRTTTTAVSGVNSQCCSGAILFAVVGGKLSEGINFSDDLGRCVIMVGMPYPSKDSPELLEKMNYLNKISTTSGGRNNKESASPGQRYYEHLCAKAVNQSMGRAIRHANDYAAILFLDKRYENANVRSRLPAWIGNRLEKANSFNSCLSALKTFFDRHKSTS